MKAERFIKPEGIHSLASSEAVARYIRSEIINEEELQCQHKAWIILIDSNHDVICHIVADNESDEGVSLTPLDIAVISTVANAYGVIIAQRHKDYSVLPTPKDMRDTKAIRDELHKHCIKLIDNIIFSNERLFSFADEKVKKISFKK